MPAVIRKLVTILDETRREMRRDLSPPIRRAVACAVIENPFAGRFEADLSELIGQGEELGALLAERAIAALGIPGERVESFGKAAVVGEAGELEHAAALLHPKMGAPVRAALGKGPALIPSAKKAGGLGTAIDVPLGHKDAAFVRSHFDAIEARVPDAPRAHEILLCLALTDGGRPLPRIGGLGKDQIEGRDGLR
ncbi:amino acid synthesis family protein [Roseicella aerolata]|uniref:Amino acid synthesis family protein n=1 Tax=Roseicella aerolata TaxID=2883479 RepID=A0A9X1IE78_9PROT|nr:amino acid synthesis family protein [Roseicella aerolata]MCB4822782.1 amino acid synthesis family protein [Roseicella aerolata]